MGYSSSAINAAMSKSLLFNNIGSNISEYNVIKIGTFEKEGYYKISFSSSTGKMFFSCEITNGQIISGQSVYDDDRSS